jgi:hypothetical protein
LVVAALAGTFWAITATCILAHRVFASNDSVNNYAHVWYAATSIWERHVLSWHMPVLNAGDGLTFPYGAPPWLLAALLWRLLDEWSVTCLLVLGGVAATAAACRWRPVLRDPLLLGLFLLNPFFIEAVVLAQLPFLWATTCFFLGAWTLERRRLGFATLFLALAQITHPAIMALPVAALVVWHARTLGRRAAAVYVVALTASLPAFAGTLATPALTESGRLAILANYVGTLAPRALVLAAPLLLGRWRHAIWDQLRLAAGAAVLAPLALLPARHDSWAMKQLLRAPSRTTVAALDDTSFHPGAVYRVLDAADGKISMYRAIRAGAVLDSDFFPESMVRRDWTSPADYVAFLDARRVDYILITRAFDRDFHTNEHAVLDALADSGTAVRVYADPQVEVYQLIRPDPGADHRRVAE